jgi:ribonuclease P protein component
LAAGPAAVERFRFQPQQRLRAKSEFDRAFAQGKRIGDNMFGLTVAALPPADSGAAPCARLGLAIAAKVIGNAVARNRVRRLVRESFRLHQHQLPAVDIVVSARAAARQASSAVLRDSLAGLWQRVAKTCAPS